MTAPRKVSLPQVSYLSAAVMLTQEYTNTEEKP